MASGRYLFVSDLHLDAGTPAAVAQFLQFLQGPARDANALYILGDLFETWIGDDDDEPVRARICGALRELTMSTPCFVMHGNRDFLLGTAFEQRSGCRLLPDPTVLALPSARVLLMHGDLLCTADHDYQEFRQLARDPAHRAAWLRLPLTTRRALAQAARAGSHAHTSRVSEAIMDVDAVAVDTALRLAQARLLIHGHTHRPAVHSLQQDGQAMTRIVLGDWYDEGSCLALGADGRYETLPLLPSRATSTVNLAASN